MSELDLHADLLRGAERISEFIFGDSSAKNVRRTYHVASTSNIPTFKIGGTICARKSKLIEWIENQESKKW